MTYQAGTPHQEPNTGTSRSKADDLPGPQQGREEERDKTFAYIRRGSHDGDTIGRKRCQQHRLGMIGSRTCPEGVIPEMSHRHDLPRTGTPGHSNCKCSMFRQCVPWSLGPQEQLRRPGMRGTRVRDHDRHCTHGVGSCSPKVKTMIPYQVRRPQWHNGVHDRQARWPHATVLETHRGQICTHTLHLTQHGRACAPCATGMSHCATGGLAQASLCPATFAQHRSGSQPAAADMSRHRL